MPPTDDTYSKAEVDALLDDLDWRMKVVVGRLGTAIGDGPNRWKNLTASQRKSLQELVNNQNEGKTRIGAFRA